MWIPNLSDLDHGWDTAVPELIPGRSYTGPRGERAKIRKLDSHCVEIGDGEEECWVAYSHFAGWKIGADEWAGCKEWARDNGWVWRDEVKR